MNPIRRSNLDSDGLTAAIGMLVLLIGTATGNAYVMLSMAIVALLVTVVLIRQGVWRNALSAVFAAAIAAVTAVAIVKL